MRLSFLRSGLLVVGATLVWQFSNFAFNVVGAHELIPEQYSILASAMGLSYLINPLILAAQTVASRESTRIIVDNQGSAIRAIVSYYVRRLGFMALAVALIVVAFSDLIAKTLRLGSWVLVALVALVLPTLVMSGIVRGVHQGTSRFGRYSLGTLAEGLTKVAAAGVLLGWLWRAPISGVLALLLSAVAGLAVNIVLLRHFPKPTGAVRLRNLPVRYSLSTLVTYGLMAVLLSVDTTAARLTLPGHTAGLYAGVSLAGKIVYFATTAIATFLFPLFSAKFDSEAGTGKWLISSVGVVLLVCAGTVAVFSVEPRLIAGTVLGPRYTGVADEIPVMGSVFAIYAVLNLLVTYLLARRQKGVIGTLALAAIIEIVGFALHHGSLTDLVEVVALTFTCAAMGCGALAGSSVLRRPARHGRRMSIVASSARPEARLVYSNQRGRHRASSRRTGAATAGATEESVAGRGRHREGGASIGSGPASSEAPAGELMVEDWGPPRVAASGAR